MDWKNSKKLKWLIFFALFFFGLFCFMKDKGYCNEFEDYEIEFENIVEPDFSDRVPVEDEYLYQFPTLSFKSVSIQQYNCRSSWGRPNAAPSHSQRQKWQEAFDMHNFNAIRTYNDAKDCVWWLPNLTWRQWGRDAWVAACAMASTKTPCAALTVAFTTMLSQYGLHCADQWDYIEDKLYWSEYHFNECIKYAQLLSGG